MSHKLAADVIVIGSGPGGSITAALCAEAGYSVILIEEGADLRLSSAPAFSQQEILQKYRNAGVSVAFGRSKLAYVEGRCVGGGSEINRGLYHRTPDTLLERWATDFGVQDTRLGDLQPHFDACEETARIEFLPGEAPLMSMRLHEGAHRLGWKSMETPRLYEYGSASVPGRKQSMSETFIPRFRRAGGRLIADTRVARLSRSNGQWQVSARQTLAGGEAQTLELSAATVFVACGAVQTPALLRRTGITMNVGNSLRFHPMLKAVGVFDDEVNRASDLDPVHQIKEFEPRFGIGCSVSKRPALALALARSEGLREVEDRWQNMAIYYVQNGGGKGKVRNLPGWRDPFVTVRYTSTDLAELAEAFKSLAKALFAAGAVKVFPCITGYPVLTSPGDIRKLPSTLARGDSNATSVHIFSSCPMGEDQTRCAADSFGRVHNQNGLYIADASLLCTPTSVNPQGTLMAIAHRNASAAIAARFR